MAEALDRLSRDQEDVAALYKRVRFAGITLVTLAEGEVSALHVGLKGTMNALFLKDLAQKTWRGREGRARAGRSAGGICFGYDVVRQLDARGEPVRGERAINEREAGIIRRAFRAFAEGQSPPHHGPPAQCGGHPRSGRPFLARHHHSRPPAARHGAPQQRGALKALPTDSTDEPAPQIGPKPESKQAMVVNLLCRPDGATLDELVEATGWQRHSVRGVISGGLKKKLGLTVVSDRDGVHRRYRITA